MSNDGEGDRKLNHLGKCWRKYRGLKERRKKKRQQEYLVTIFKYWKENVSVRAHGC